MQDSPQQQMRPPWMSFWDCFWLSSFWDCFWLLSLQPFTDVQQNGEEQLERKAILPHNRSYDCSYKKIMALPRMMRRK
jgi:hypothetical protein